MHESVLKFVERELGSEHISGKRVLEVGSYDVNGSVRPYLETLGPAEYLGVDASAGPRVDQVVDCEKLCASVGVGAWDVVISTEMLEHVTHWRRCIEEMTDALNPGGLLVLTTRSPGFPYHPYPEDNWRYTISDMAQIVDALGLVQPVIENDPEAPGVFVTARRQARLSPSRGLLDFIDVRPVNG